MKSLTIIGSMASLASAFCAHGTTLFPRSAGDEVKIASYGFQGMKGPLNWYGLNKTTNVACARGKEQSPINVFTKTHKSVDGSSLDFNIQSYDNGADLVNLGSTLEVIANGSLKLDSKDYKLAQFHFHTPSEHHIDDEHYPAEVHFVFQAEDKSLSVVGFPIELHGKNSDFVAKVFDKVDKVTQPGSKGTTGKLDFTKLRSHLHRSKVYQYKGSLTTPPCSEGVAWNVVRNPVAINVKTYKAIKRIMKFNSRYIQAATGETNLLENAANMLAEKA
ncbi:carbonate dehydratase [Magnaporthiopsis poae ATCC 64411]|uniref:Carbonic anhydrase n=1 Tax=Magnaporthiopsis poae (strain ATCC 64411 / 73-15) TaxID=644358 RepID=A0A0C4DKN4_MAGP6|nr:carbonate dehydratase [Magnaporthiopsis poae ATCC 64411]